MVRGADLASLSGVRRIECGNLSGIPFDSVTMNRPGVLGLTREGSGSVCRRPTIGAATWPHSAILVGVDVKALAVCIGVLGGHDHGGSEQRAE